MSNNKIFIVLAILATGLYTISTDKTTSQPVKTTVQIHPHLSQICQATASILFCQNNDDVTYMHYIRPSDNSLWKIKCRLKGDRVEWASNNVDNIGRWRIDENDEKITFSITGNSLKLIDTYSDGSSIKQMYTLNSL
ncbi:hypothetical protein BB987_11080 [Photorhabdus temperata]|uniref:Uncharacterized protein n=3 Tax=Photorhabdus TaxID=29487 RepID=A0A7X5QLX3_9GAMM|nr:MULTISPECIES: hypothetical protein [Photorhabdus]ETS33377.1 hypothetical protein PTE_00537 [Photorhabdus khanii NC19]MQL47751.1 hypothetical protein [Photorhabdus khanii]NHB96720.1 hypothetical protein [Photorhabdus stackebrandtii]OHV53916.1 hypothetical protein BB987_11080 [Photorhabdus temperata]